MRITAETAETLPAFEKRQSVRFRSDSLGLRKAHAQSCRRKKRFHSHESATDMIKTIQRKYADDYDRLRAYECPFCKGWHLAHVKDEE